MTDSAHPLTRTQAAAAVSAQGWRFLLGSLRTQVAVSTPDDAQHVLGRVLDVAGPRASDLSVTWQAGILQLDVQDRTTLWVTAAQTELATAITEALAAGGHLTRPEVGPRPVQAVEIGIDTLDRASIRPFWKAVLAYVDDSSDGDDPNGLVDPLGQGPAVWFQDMDAPRPQRNRLHLDVTVGEDEGERRVAAALAAGGRLLSDARAKAFWVLADVEGNEVCVCTWQDRD